MNALFSDADSDLRAIAWRPSPQGYARYGNRLAHRIVIERVFGVITGKRLGQLLTDHINRDRLDNRRENLRLATPHESMLNRGRAKRTLHATASVGVSRTKSGKWQAGVETRRDGKRKFHYVGLFLIEEEAIAAAQIKRSELNKP